MCIRDSCKRIQMKYMLPAFRQEDYDAGMLAGLAVTAEVLAGGTPDLSEPEGELSGGAILAIVGLVVGLLLALGILNYYRSRRCPHCRRFTLRQHSVEQVALTRTYREMEYTYVCSSCGATVRRRVRSERGNRFGGPGGGMIIGGGGFGGMGGGSIGGSFGGGSFGGGGAGSKW